MFVGELVVWAGMSGAIALLCMVSIADCLVQRTLAARRGLAFVLMIGGAGVVLSGLLAQLFPAVDFAPFLPVTATIGPLGGALGMSYLGIWLGAGRDEPMTRWCVFAGSLTLVIASIVLAWFGMDGDARLVMTWSELTCLFMVALAVFVSARGALLGDALARWMVVACALLGIAVIGFYAKATGNAGWGLGGWVITALAAVGFFLTVIILTIQRNREVRHLRRLAKGLAGQNFDIPMPQGSQLIPKVAEAMWRSQRLDRPCVVAAIAVRNLYELGDELGHGVEAQILAVLAARIRRHVGFRNVVGLYHPRCFVMAVSPGQDPRRGVLLEETLLRSIRACVRVGPPDHQFDFWPSVGMGVVELTHSVKHAQPDALTAINRAEHMALEDQTMGDMMSQSLDFDTLPGRL
jgi:GGDEF domain-containing protein